MDLSPMWEQLQGMLDYVLILIPNLVIGLVVFGLFFLAARGLRGLALRFSEERRRHRNLGMELGRLVYGSATVNKGEQLRPVASAALPVAFTGTLVADQDQR